MRGSVRPLVASSRASTILSLTETAIPSGHTVDGQKLDALLTGKADSRRSETFLMHYPHAPHRSDYWTSYRASEWKVIYHYFLSAASEQSHYQLFNLRADPFEQDNLATKNPDDLRRMMRGLIAALEEHHALYPVDKDRQPLKPELP